MRKLNLSTILVLIGYCVLAQTDYLVTTKTDTIKSDLRILSYDNIDRIQVSINGKKEVFTALQVLIVNMDSVNYKPIQKDNTIRFMKIIKSGYLSLYAFVYPNQHSYDGRYLVRLDGTNLEVPNISFKKIMTNYLENCNEVSEKIKNGELGKADINTIIDEYNICAEKLKPASSAVASSEELKALQNLSAKVKELNFDDKEDAQDILKDIQLKLEKKEKVSKYLIEGLETALKDQTTITEELTKLTDLLKKN